MELNVTIPADQIALGDAPSRLGGTFRMEAPSIYTTRQVIVIRNHEETLGGNNGEEGKGTFGKHGAVHSSGTGGRAVGYRGRLRK